jgi:integrase
MPGKQAKILSEDDLQDLLVYASATRNPIRNRVIVLLSAKAGLRAGEIANLTWDMILEPNGAISTVLELRDCAAKKRSGRMLPLHKDLRDALASWRGITHGMGPVVLSERGCAMTHAKHRRMVCTRISSRRP